MNFNFSNNATLYIAVQHLTHSPAAKINNKTNKWTQMQRGKSVQFVIFERIHCCLRWCFIFHFSFRVKMPLHRFTISHRSVALSKLILIYYMHWKISNTNLVLYVKSICSGLDHNTVSMEFKANQCDSYSFSLGPWFRQQTNWNANKTHEKRSRTNQTQKNMLPWSRQKEKNVWIEVNQQKI